eukprot:752016-Amorphochlora_amoeboformis.AAC.2
MEARGPLRCVRRAMSKSGSPMAAVERIRAGLHPDEPLDGRRTMIGRQEKERRKRGGDRNELVC